MEIDFLQEQLAAFGVRLRTLRQERQWTLDDLSRNCGLSKAHLSRLESGDRQASIASVLTLSRLFGVSLAAMFEGEKMEPVVVIRNGGTISFDADGLTCWPLTAGTHPMILQPMRVVISADRKGDERRQHEGEEWIYVLSGELTLLVGSRSYDLDAGDAAHFDARLPHRLMPRSGLEAEILLVAAPGQSRVPVHPAGSAGSIS
jgi:transcriptional regulator with XRE-family HTH domain